MAIRPGDVLGKYRVSRQLEDGWLAERTQDFEQQVFVALLPENFTNADEVEFLERRQKVAQLHETAIPRLISSGETREGLPYTLFDYTQTEAALAVAEGENRPLRQRVDLAIQVLEALKVVHRLLLAYGNLSNESLRLTPTGAVQLPVLPLCCRHNDPVADDVAAAADFLRALLAAKQPLPQDLQAILDKANHASPASRYLSAEALMQDLQAYLEHKPVSARKQTPLYRAKCLTVRQPVFVSAGIALLLAVSVATGLSIVQDAAAKRSRDQAKQRLRQLQELTSTLETNLYQPVSQIPNSKKAKESLIQWTAQSLDAIAVQAGNDEELRRQLASGYLRLAEMQRMDGDEVSASSSIKKAQDFLPNGPR